MTQKRSFAHCCVLCKIVYKQQSMNLTSSPYMDAPRLQEQSFDDDDTESIAAIHSVSDAAVVGLRTHVEIRSLSLNQPIVLEAHRAGRIVTTPV
jgi:hypothetical protein